LIFQIYVKNYIPRAILFATINALHCYILFFLDISLLHM